MAKFFISQAMSFGFAVRERMESDGMDVAEAMLAVLENYKQSISYKDMESRNVVFSDGSNVVLMIEKEGLLLCCVGPEHSGVSGYVALA